MQLIFFTVFVVGMIVWLTLGVQPDEADFKLKREIVAAHMETWHTAAVKFCVQSSCGVAVNPKGSLPPTVAAGDAFDVARFSTSYDSASKLIVTSIRDTWLQDSGLTYSVILSGLNSDGNRESSSIGVFDEGTSRINLVNNIPTSLVRHIDVPASIAGRLDDGSPVLVNRL